MDLLGVRVRVVIGVRARLDLLGHIAMELCSLHPSRVRGKGRVRLRLRLRLRLR